MMARLKKQHEGLLLTYNVLWSKCLFDKQKIKFSEYLAKKPEGLIIPDLMKDEVFLNSLKEFDIDPSTVASIDNNDPEDKLMNYSVEVGYVSGEILFLWHKFFDLLRVTSRFICSYYEFDSMDKAKRMYFF